MDKAVAKQITELLKCEVGLPFTLFVNPVNPMNHSLKFQMGRTTIEAKGKDIPEILEKLTRD